MEYNILNQNILKSQFFKLIVLNLRTIRVAQALFDHAMDTLLTFIYSDNRFMYVLCFVGK